MCLVLIKIIKQCEYYKPRVKSKPQKYVLRIVLSGQYVYIHICTNIGAMTILSINLLELIIDLEISSHNRKIHAYTLYYFEKIFHGDFNTEVRQVIILKQS